MIITVNTVYAGNGPTVTSNAGNITCDSEIVCETTIPANTANKEVDLNWKVANMKGIIIVPSDNLTMYTNAASGGSPAQTITLNKNVGLAWATGNNHPNPITTDVTKLYFTNGTAADVTIKIRVALVETV